MDKTHFHIDGAWVAPSVPNDLLVIDPSTDKVADVANDMRIVQEEMFGPVHATIPFDGKEEGVAIANDTTYGMSGDNQTSDPVRAGRAARKLRSVQVQINGNAPDVDMPFGGYKRSGNGREGSVFGLEEYLEVKAVVGLPS